MKRRIVAVCLAAVLVSSSMAANAEGISNVEVQNLENNSSAGGEVSEGILEQGQLEDNDNADQPFEDGQKQMKEEEGKSSQDIQDRGKEEKAVRKISLENLDSLQKDENAKAAAGNTITVKTAGELESALKSARAGTASNPYTINLAAGSYSLSKLAVPSYVTINTGQNVILNMSGDIAINSNVTLNLQGSIIKYAGKTSKYALYIKPDVQNVSIAGGNIEGGGIYINKASSVSLKNIVVKNYSENGVYANESNINSIESLSCHGGIGGISLKQTPVSSITNCRIQNFSDAGIKLTGVKAVVPEVSSNIIIGASKTAKTNGIYLKEGAAAGNIKNNTVTNCYIGIYLTGAKAGSITNNSVNEIGEHGIYLANKSSLTGSISGNTVKSFARSGIQLYIGCTVKGKLANNKIQDGKGTGILVTGPRDKAEGSTAGNIEKNEITNCTGDGIGIYHASHCGSISNNTLDTIGGNHNGNEGDYGIIVDSMMKADTYCTKINGNVINNVTYAAIAIYSGPSGSKSKVYQDTAYVKGNIENNVVTNSGTYKPSKDWKKEVKKGCLSGIYVDTHARVKGNICNNTVNKTGEHGIYLHLMSYVKNIYGNTVSDTKEAGIEIFESTVERDIYKNVVNNAGTNGIAGGSGGVVKGKIRENIIKNPKGCGIYLDLSKFSEISNNKISGVKKHGIYVTDKSAANNILSNVISVSNAKDGCAVKISEDSTVAKIYKNNMKGRAAYGVRVAGAKRNMEISSNTMTTLNAPREEYNAVRLMKGKNFTYTVKNNKITGNKTNYGIRVDDGKARITGNTVKKATYPIYISSNKYKVTVSDNSVSGCTNNEIKTAQKKVSTKAVVLQSVKNVKGSKAKISWRKRSDISNYEVYQSEKKGKAFKKITDAKGKTYTADKLKKGKTYYYKIRGYQKDRNVMVYADWSKELSVKISK